jgi:hypothetical protein
MTDDNEFDFFDINIEDSVEPELLNAGDYELQILSAELHTNEERGTKSIHVVFAAQNSGLTNPSPIHRYFGLPNADDKKETLNSKGLALKRFCKCFGIQARTLADLITQVNGGALVGKLGECKIDIEQPAAGSTYEPKNVIKRFNERNF